MTFSVSFTKKEDSKADTVVIGVFQDNKLTSSAKEINERENGLVSGCLNGNQRFKGKNGEIMGIIVSINLVFIRNRPTHVKCNRKSPHYFRSLVT